MNIINLTPHALRLLAEDGKTVATEIQPSGQIARVAAKAVLVGHAGAVPLYHTEYGAVEGLPEPQPETIYVVSGLVRAAVPHREDVYSPGRLVRDDQGRPVGAIGLTR